MEENDTEYKSTKQQSQLKEIAVIIIHFHENYKEVNVAFSNGFTKLISLNSGGKHNEKFIFDHPVKTSFVNIMGVSTFSEMPVDHWLGKCHCHTGFRSGLSEIRIFGCSKGT